MMTDNQDQDRKQKQIDSIHEEIASYLDGELDAKGVERVEQRLAKNKDYRQRVQEMERAWNCLDALPEAHVDESFTCSTVEMVAVVTEKEFQQNSVALRRRLTYRKCLLASGVGLAAAAIGFSATVALAPDPNETLLKDLPVIENVERYLYADSIEFLQKLHEEGLFHDEESKHAG